MSATPAAPALSFDGAAQTPLLQFATAPPTSPAELDHLSWSSIQTYQKCPRCFQFRYLEHAPAEFTPASLAFGSAFHQVVDVIQQARLEGATIPELPVLLTHFDSSWRELTCDTPPVKYAKATDAQTLHNLAGRMLTAYRSFVLSSNSAAQIIGIEEAVRFKLIPGAPEILMRLDVVEHSGDELILSDIKTSKSRYSQRQVIEALPQLILYAFGLLPMMKALGAKRIVPRFAVVTKAVNPVVQIICPQATQADATRLREQVAETWRAIQAGIFFRRESWACSQCVFQHRCLGR